MLCANRCESALTAVLHGLSLDAAGQIQDFQDMEELFDYSCHPKILKCVCKFVQQTT